MTSSDLLDTALAVQLTEATDLLLALVQRYTVSRGITGRLPRSGRVRTEGADSRSAVLTEELASQGAR